MHRSARLLPQRYTASPEVPGAGRAERRRSGTDRALAVVLAVAGAVAWTLPAAAGEGPAPERATETLQALVSQLVELEVEAAAEDTRWREEKSHLETTLSLLGKEGEGLDRELASAEAEAGVAATERESLTKRVEAAAAALRATDEAAHLNGKRLLAGYDALPEPLKGPLKPGAARVREALFGEAGGRGVAGRLQLVNAFAADLDRVLSSVHAVKQVLAPGDVPPGPSGPLSAAAQAGDVRPAPRAGPREVDVLYIGGAIGFYVFPEGDSAGVLAPAAEGWRASPREGLGPRVRRALAVLRKEEPATLVELPVKIPVAPAAGPAPAGRKGGTQ